MHLTYKLQKKKKKIHVYFSISLFCYLKTFFLENVLTVKAYL